MEACATRSASAGLDRLLMSLDIIYNEAQTIKVLNL